MDFLFISCFIYYFNVINCYSDSESAESNRIEVTPFYDTIIYSDIADIINDFENNGISPFDMFANSESQSDEKVEDLLNEYQHYLEKAHKQRKNYIEKSKTKNKVPLLRHDPFSKTKPGIDLKHNDYYYSNGFYNSAYKFPQPSFSNPLDIFMPFNSKGKYINKPEITTSSPKVNHGDLFPFEKIIFNDEKILDLPPVIHKSSFEPIKSPCFCKNGHFPCDCNCKQCLIHMEPFSKEQQMKLHSPEEQKKSGIIHPSLFDNSMKKYDQVMDENMKDSDNTLNIRIKVDLQLPKLQENFGKYYKTHNRDRTFEPDDVMSKELTTAIKLPFPYFNFPIPMQLFSKKSSKYNKEDSAPIHKITLHKKNKSRSNNNNKKHRKKIITFHNIKLEQQPLFPLRFDDNVTDTPNHNNKSNLINDTTFHLEINSMLNKTDDILNETQTEESIFLMVNISNNTYNNTTEENHKIENSIETDFTKIFSNMTTRLPIIREKREISKLNILANNRSNNKLLKNNLSVVKSNITKEKNNGKKSDKNMLADAELLYWPSVSRNETYIKKKNITTIILENEHKKTKLNMSKETIRQNHTRALEQAIFGEVDWDDIDTVAPAFMSFVGKYVRGILTFCSQQVCHSMNCANKTCLHRICIPADRLNNKGHCAGSNSTDSVASMESIMDLPSNIAFEVVDILQNKMLGKIFGKATFCINTKCITLAASKKTFVKSRCTIKELNTTGHCLSAKTVKVI